MRGHARLWLLRRSLALEISSQSKKQSRRSRSHKRQADISALRCIILFVNPLEYGTFPMEERQRRQPQNGDKRGRRNRTGRWRTRRIRIEGTNEREESRYVYERRTTFCRTSLLACRPILRVFRTPPSAPHPFGSHCFLLVFPGLP